MYQECKTQVQRHCVCSFNLSVCAVLSVVAVVKTNEGSKKRESQLTKIVEFPQPWSQ